MECRAALSGFAPASAHAGAVGQSALRASARAARLAAVCAFAQSAPPAQRAPTARVSRAADAGCFAGNQRCLAPAGAGELAERAGRIGLIDATDLPAAAQDIKKVDGPVLGAAGDP